MYTSIAEAPLFDSRIMLNAVINWVKFISSPSVAAAALCFRRWSKMRAELSAIFQIMAIISCSTSSCRPLLLPPTDEALHYVQIFHVCGQKINQSNEYLRKCSHLLRNHLFTHNIFALLFVAGNIFSTFPLEIHNLCMLFWSCSTSHSKCHFASSYW